MMLKRVLKPLAQVVLHTPLPEWVFEYRARRKLTVLAYHRILPSQGDDYPFDDGVISATPEEFERELRYYNRHLDVISMPELIEGLKRPDTLPERPAVVTFDDGYYDNHDHALPILSREKIPATFFLSTRIVGTSNIPWWDFAACCLKHSRTRVVSSPFAEDDPPYDLDRPDQTLTIRRFLHRLIESPWESVQNHLDRLAEVTGVNPNDYLERPLFMSWEEVRRMKEAGMDLGGHTRTHPILGRMSDPAALREEIAGCYEDLIRMAGHTPVSFAYPVGRGGALSDAAEAEIRAAGFQISFSFINANTRLTRHLHPPYPRAVTEFGGDYQAFRLGMLRLPTFSVALPIPLLALLHETHHLIGLGHAGF